MLFAVSWIASKLAPTKSFDSVQHNEKRGRNLTPFT
jgi:hypothetical protein